MPLFDEIRQLLASPETGPDAPELERVEHTLTSGYARALALQAEQWRIERRLGELVGRDKESVRELALLTERLDDATGELSALRRLLVPLRSRAANLRVGAEARATL